MVVALAVIPPAAAAEVYRIDSTHSSIGFSISKWTVTRQSGIFREVEGTVVLSPGRLEDSRVDLRIRAASIDTRNATRDSVVRSNDFLDADAHPFISFRSTGIRRRGPDRFDVAGELTIRGVTRPIIAPVRLLGMSSQRDFGEIASFETTLLVDRRHFGVLGSRWSGGQAILGNEVTIQVAITARRNR